MKMRYLLFLKDIMESMNRINDYIKGVEYDSFSNNQLLIDAYSGGFNPPLLGKSIKHPLIRLFFI